jgi:hypothetical protein
MSFSYFLRLGRWVSADAAAVFAAALEFGSRRTLDAAVAAALLVTSGFFAILFYLLDLTTCPIRRTKDYVFVGSSGKKYMDLGRSILPTIS